MTMLLRRAPREVYRVYDEDEYLAGATWEPDVESAPAPVPSDLRRRRILSAAILLGATSAVGGAIALNGLTQSQGSSRRHGARMRLATAESAVSTGLHGTDHVTGSRTRMRTHPPRRVPFRWASDRARRRSHGTGSALAPQGRDREESVGIAAGPARLTASAHIASERARPAEFGFER
jgi:hypothetical protein